MGSTTLGTRRIEDQVITIRASQRQREMIDQAARIRGESRSVFILEAACREAEGILLDQGLFFLDAVAWEQFQAWLDDPPLLPNNFVPY